MGGYKPLGLSLEESLSRNPIPLGLEIDINHCAVLICRSPQVVLFAIDPNEYFIDEEGLTVTTVLSLQPPGIFRAKFDTPKTNRLMTSGNPSLS